MSLENSAEFFPTAVSRQKSAPVGRRVSGKQKVTVRKVYRDRARSSADSAENTDSVFTEGHKDGEDKNQDVPLPDVQCPMCKKPLRECAQSRKIKQRLMSTCN